MRKLIYSAVGAAALASASIASAATVITSNPTPAVYTPPATGGFLGVVSPSSGATNSTVTNFNDTFMFTILGAPGQVNAQVGTILLNGIQNLGHVYDGNNIETVIGHGRKYKPQRLE